MKRKGALVAEGVEDPFAGAVPGDDRVLLALVEVVPGLLAPVRSGIAIISTPPIVAQVGGKAAPERVWGLQGQALQPADLRIISKNDLPGGEDPGGSGPL